MTGRALVASALAVAAVGVAGGRGTSARGRLGRAARGGAVRGSGRGAGGAPGGFGSGLREAVAGGWRRWPRRGRDAGQRAAALRACTAFAAELRGGQPARAALQRAGGERVWPSAAAAARLGGDVAAALRGDADRARVPVLRGLAACWQVGEASGAGLAAAVERLCDTARAAEDVRRQLLAELAGPRATARVLGMLPLVGVGLGVLLGADPLGWLLTSRPGPAVAAAGCTLTGLGLLWTRRIAARVEARL